MSDVEARVYGNIDGELTVQDLIDRAGLGDFETCRILYDLLTRGIIKAVRAEAARKMEPAPRGPAITSVFWSLLSLLVFLGALASLWTMGKNPLNRLPPAYVDPQLDEILTAITRSHVQRLDDAIQIYYLQQGQLPAHVSELQQQRTVETRTLKDAWGNPLGYERSGQGYRILVFGAAGGERPDLTIERPSGGSPGTPGG
jgi:hypothetical protein